MEDQYKKLNKKLDNLTNNNTKYNNTQKTTQFQPKVINLSNVNFTKEQIQLLSLGPNYAIEKEPKKKSQQTSLRRTTRKTNKCMLPHSHDCHMKILSDFNKVQVTP
jgi:hypothetical protein